MMHKSKQRIILYGDKWVHLENPDMSVEAAVSVLRAQGQEILEVDVPGRRVRCQVQSRDEALAKAKEEPLVDIYVCERCGSFSTDKRKTEEHEASCQGPGIDA